MKSVNLSLGKPCFFLVAAAVLSLAACSPKAAVKELDAPAVKAVAMKGVDAPKARRLVVVPIEAKASGKSVTAKCKLTSPYYSAEFTAPANLQLPDYGAKTPSIAIACESEAGKGGLTVAPASVENNNAAAVGGALFGVVGAVIASSASQENDSEHFYRAINVRLK